MDFQSKLIPFKESFLKECCTPEDIVHYEKKGITNIEGFYWWSLVGLFKPDVIIESGVAFARSTEILARAQQYFKVTAHFAFDKETVCYEYSKKKLSRYKTVYEIGDSNNKIEKLCNELVGKKIVLIIDGPKSGEPYKNIIKTLSQFEKLCAVASHDCKPHGKTKITRNSLIASVEAYLPNYGIFFSSPDTNKKLESLNNCILGEISDKNPEFLKDSGFHYVGIAYNKNYV